MSVVLVWLWDGFSQERPALLKEMAPSTVSGRRILETMDSGVPSDPKAMDEMASTPEECPRERLSANSRQTTPP